MAIEAIDPDQYVQELVALQPEIVGWGGNFRIQVTRDLQGRIIFWRYVKLEIDRKAHRLRVYYDSGKRLPDGRVDREYRFQIGTINRGVFQDEVIRFETDMNHPTHAHFPPRYVSEVGDHFTVDMWPPNMQVLTLGKVFEFFKRVGDAGGRLPPPFGPAR